LQRIHTDAAYTYELFMEDLHALTGAFSCIESGTAGYSVRQADSVSTIRSRQAKIASYRCPSWQGVDYCHAEYGNSRNALPAIF